MFTAYICELIHFPLIDCGINPLMEEPSTPVWGVPSSVSHQTTFLTWSTKNPVIIRTPYMDLLSGAQWTVFTLT